MEKKDIYGNTPLGVSLMRRHYNYGIILIQKQASVLPLTFKEDSERIAKMWAEEEKLKKLSNSKKGNRLNGNLDTEMEDETVKKSKKKNHRNLFNNTNGYADYGDEYDDEYDEEDEDDDNMGYNYQENVFN